MKQFDSIWIVWLILVAFGILGWPEAPPIADVMVAASLSIFAFQYKNYKK